MVSEESGSTRHSPPAVLFFRTCVFAALANLLAGCETIYVANVPFDAIQICSQELASKLHPSSGCLPVTRAQNAQGFYAVRYRLQVSGEEAKNIVESAPVNENGSANGATAGNGGNRNVANQLPSLLGRVFVARPNGNSLWAAPSSGNIAFLPLKTHFQDKPTPPESLIRTQVMFKSSLQGAVQKRLQASAEFNPTQVVERALQSVGIAALPPGLKQALIDHVATVGYGRQSRDLAKAGYYYVSIAPDLLDSLTTAVALCNWHVDQSPIYQDQVRVDGFGGSLFNDGQNFISSNSRKRCAASLRDSPSIFIRDEAIRLIAAIEGAAEQRKDISVAGIVIGVGILHTEGGQSQLCTDLEVALIGSGDHKPATGSCGSLRGILDAFDPNLPGRPASAAPMDHADEPARGAAGLTEDQKRALLVSLNASYSRVAYSALDVHGHTSVLAIHWLPVRVRD